jgi:hypothetical protein
MLSDYEPTVMVVEQQAQGRLRAYQYRARDSSRHADLPLLIPSGRIASVRGQHALGNVGAEADRHCVAFISV